MIHVEKPPAAENSSRNSLAVSGARSVAAIR